MSYKAITIYTPPDSPPHISAEDDAFIYNSLVGGRSGIFGSLTCTIVNDTRVRLGGGGVINKGYVMYIPSGTTHELTVDEGTQSLSRHDLVVAEFIKGGGSDADLHRFKIIKGTPSAAPADPPLTTSPLLSKGDTCQMAIFRIVIDGYTLRRIEPLVQNLSQTDYIRCKAVSGTVTPTDSEITQVPLTQTGAIISGSNLSVSEGRIKCAINGVVEVCGSTYMTGTADAESYFGCYVLHNNTELTPGMRSANQDAAVSTPPDIVSVSAGDTLTLCCRTNCANGACLGNNVATWLSVKYI